MHRDIKPQNIMLDLICDKYPLIKLIDWGSATYYDPENDGKLCDKCGTVAYMAPE